MAVRGLSTYGRLGKRSFIQAGDTVAKRQLREFDRYRYGKRSYLYSGYRFRASGGPHFVGTNDDGKRVRIPMNEAGVFVFRRYCEYGASKWIAAYSECRGIAIVYVGRPRKSSHVDGLRLRPHKIRLVTERRRKKSTKVQREVQGTLFDTQG